MLIHSNNPPCYDLATSMPQSKTPGAAAFRLSRGAAKWSVLLLASCGHVLGFQNASAAPAGSESGASAIWVFANLSFTGMRAQDRGSLAWKIISFIFGFPGTLLTLMIVEKGSQRAYGIDMPRKQEP
jgi:hypothetical protein